MKAARAILGASLLTLAAPSAAAEPSRATPATVLLPVTLKGSSTGKGTFEFGAGAAWRLGNDYDLGVTVVGDVATTSGLATLFGVQSSSDSVDHSYPWNLGLELSFWTLEAPVVTGANAGLEPEVHRSMVNACNATCDYDETSTFCKGRGDVLKLVATSFVEENTNLAAGLFCKARQETVTKIDANAALDEKQKTKLRVAELNGCVASCAVDAGDPFCSLDGMARARRTVFRAYSKANVCDAGKKIYDDYEDERGRSLLPSSTFIGGFKIGNQSFAYRARSAADPSLLVEKTDHQTIWKAGLIASFMGKLGPVRSAVEMQALLDSSVTAARKTVKWCRSEGVVARPNAKPGDPADPAQSCQDATLGAPGRTSAFTARIHGSLFDSNRGNWRVAFGPEISFPFEPVSSKSPIYGFALPVYLAATLFEKVDYKGVLRLTPTFTHQKIDDLHADDSIAFELALLGERGIFSNHFDSL